MSVVFNATSDYLRRTASLPSSTTMSMCAWIRKRSVTEGRYTYWLNLEDATTNATDYQGIGQDNANTFELQHYQSIITFTRAPSAEQWIFIAWTIAGTAAGQMHGYLARDGDGTLEVIQNTAVVTSFTAAMLSAGNNSYSEYLDGDMAHVRVWDAELSQAEVEAEWASARAVRTTNLHLEWRLADNTDTNDLSVNARNPTIGGTLESGTHPPVGSGIAVPVNRLVVNKGIRPAFFKPGLSK
jgi:hypothetical protein